MLIKGKGPPSPAEDRFSETRINQGSSGGKLAGGADPADGWPLPICDSTVMHTLGCFSSVVLSVARLRKHGYIRLNFVIMIVYKLRLCVTEFSKPPSGISDFPQLTSQDQHQ